jgi:hypothetical protein
MVPRQARRNKPIGAGAARWAFLAGGASSQILVAAIRASGALASGGLLVLSAVKLSATELAEGPSAGLNRHRIGGAFAAGGGRQVECITSNELEGGSARGEVGGCCGGGVWGEAEADGDRAFGSI